SMSISVDATNSNLSGLCEVIPAEISVILGKPPVLGVENQQAYEALFVALAVEWEPKKTTEWLFVRDLADLNWEILRLRRGIAGVFEISFRGALVEMLKAVRPGGDPYDWEVEELVSKWYKGSTARNELKSELTKHGLDPESAISQTFLL